MDTTLLFSSKPLLHVGKLPSFLPPTPRLRLSFTRNTTTKAAHKPHASAISSAGTLILTAAALLSARLSIPAPAIAVSPPSTLEKLDGAVETGEGLGLLRLINSNPEALVALRSLVYRKLELGEDDEALKLIQKLIVARPEELEWRFLSGRVLNEMGRLSDARKVFDEILERDPLSFEALFENSVLMDRCGEGDEAMDRLHTALEQARGEGKDVEAREVRLIMAQLQYLQKKVDEALGSYEELSIEDPADYRPYFCQGVIYTLMGRDEEAREKFAKYKEVSPRKFDVEGFLQSPLSRMKLFGTGNS